MYQRGAEEHGCDFAPVAGYKNDFSKFLVPFTALRQHLYSVKSTAIFKNLKIYATEWNSATLYI